MSIETSLPFSWLRTASPDIVALDEIPLWGSPPPFPWDVFANNLSKTLNLPSLQITPSAVQWLSKEELLNNMGNDPALICFKVSPLEGAAFWLLPREELKGLLRIATGADPLANLDNFDWQEEFQEFLAFEATLAFQKSGFDASLTPQIVKDLHLPVTPTLTIDIEISTGSNQFHGRLAFTPELRKSIRKKYATTKLAYPTGLTQALTATVHLVAGNVALTRKEWAEIVPGDFLILDSCTIVPDESKGRILLVVNGSPLFRGKLKEGNIKILEYPLLQEVHTPMAKQEEEFEEEEFEGEEDSEFEDENSLEETEESSDETHEELDELADEENLEETEELPPVEALASSQTKVPTAQSLTKPEEIPLTLSVEVGRLLMSVKQLVELAPGNVLELDIYPENGVDLVVNGQCIGKGELLKIGDALGVRILDKA